MIITSIADDSITYIDPGIGADKQNESLTVKKEGFLKAWQGNVTLETQKLQVVSDHQSKTMSAQEAQKIRGAFWGSLLGFLGSIFVWIPGLNFLGLALTGISTVVSAIEGDWLSAISSIVTLGMAPNGFGGFFKDVFKGVTSAVSGLGTVFNAVGGFVSNVYKAVSGFAGSLVDGIGGFLHGALGVSSKIAGNIASTAVGVGLNLGVSKGLEVVGVNPEIAGFFGSLASGAIIGGFRPTDATKGVTQAMNVKQSLSNVITLTNVGRLGLELGLDSSFTNIVGLSLSAIQGELITNPATNLEKAFSNIKPGLFSSLSFYGVEKLGASFGIDPRLTSLIGVPISAGVNAGFLGGVNVGTNIVSAINDGFMRGVVSMAIDYAGQALNLSPLFTGLSARAIMGGLEGMLGQSVNQGKGFFEGMMQSIGSSLFNALTFDQAAPSSSMTNAMYLQRILRFSDIAKTEGIEVAIENHLSAILQRDAVETVFKQGGISQLISKQAVPITDDEGNVVSIKISTGIDSSIYLDPTKQNVIGRDFGNIKERGVYGVDPLTGEFKLIEGRIYQDFDFGFNVIYVKNGFIKDVIPVSNSGDYAFHLSSRDPEVGIIIDQYHFDAVVEDIKEGTKTTFKDGQVIKIEKINTTNGQLPDSDTAKVSSYKNNSTFLSVVSAMPSGALIASRLRQGLFGATRTHGFSFGSEFITAKSKVPLIIKTSYGTFEESYKQGQDYVPDGKLTLIGKSEDAFKVTLSGKVSASFDGETSASLTVSASGQTDYFGITLKGGGFGKFEGALDIITGNNTKQLMDGFKGTFTKGVHTEQTTVGGPAFSIDTYIEGDSIIHKTTFSQSDGHKNIYYMKFKPQKDGEPSPIKDPVLEINVKALTVLYDLLNGDRSSMTQSEKDVVNTFMYNSLNQAQQGQQGQINNISTVAKAFAESVPVMVNDYSRQIPDIILGALYSGNTSAVSFNPIDLGLIFGKSLLNPIFPTGR